MRSRLSLRTILILSLAALAALPILGIGLITQHVVSRHLTARITSQNLTLARTLAAEVRQFLDRPLLLLEELRDNIFRYRLVEESKVTGYLGSVIKHHRRLFNMIVILDRRGLVRHIAPYNPDYIGVNWSRHAVFRRPRRGVKAHWSTTFISPRTGHPTLTISIPFARGMLVGYLNLAVLRRITGRVDMGGEAYVAIADQRGTAIAHRDQSAVSQQLNLKDMEVVRQGLAGREGTYRFVFQDRLYLGSVAVVRQTGWPVLVVQPYETAFAVVTRMRNVIWLGILAGLAVALVLGAWTLGRVQRPLSRLVASSEQIAAGDYDYTPPPPGLREIDDLVRAFEAMSVGVKDREASLRRSEERYRTLFDSIMDYIYIHDLEGNFLRVNPSLLENIGYTVEEIIGRPISDFMLPQHRTAFREEYLEAVRSKGRDEGLFKLVDKEGREHYIEYRSVLVESPGQASEVSGSGRDVTERILAEKEMRKLEEQLTHSHKMEAVGTLASGVAHEFNNILQIIDGSIQLARMKDQVDHKTTLDEIERMVSRAADLVQRMLTLSHKVSPELKMVDLNNQIQQMVGLLERTIPKMISIETKLDSEQLYVGGDPHQLQQVLMNLATNARDAMPDGGRLVIETARVTLDKDDVKTLPDVAPGQYVRLRVSDTGIGMGKETTRHVFEPFYTTKKVGAGTGLGLSTVYGIIKGHGGHISSYARKLCLRG